MNPDAGGPPWSVVVDTNVLLSAALCPEGVPARLVARLLVESRLVFSEATYAELERRIWKPKFDPYLSTETRRGLLHDFNASAHWVEVPPRLATAGWSRDGDDDHFIRAALASGSRWLVTGDRDLLVLRSVEGLVICTPRQALEALEEAGAGAFR